MDPRGSGFADASRAFLAGVGAELHAARRERGWTRQQPIERCGVQYSPERIANGEHGARAVPIVASATACRTIELSVTEVAGRAYTTTWASCTAIEPTPPAAPWTRMVWPVATRPGTLNVLVPNSDGSHDSPYWVICPRAFPRRHVARC